MRHLAKLPAKKLIAVAAIPALLALLTIGSAAAQYGQAEPATNEAKDLHNLYLLVAAMGTVVFLLVEGALVVVLIRFRKRSDDLPPQIEGNNLLEVIWTGIPVLIVIVLFVFSFITLVDVEHKSKEDEMTVRVNGFQFSWEFVYNMDDLGKTQSDKQGTVSVIGTAAEEPQMVIPVGEPIHFQLRSNDVIHSFFVRNWLYKLDVVPGRDNDFVVTADKTGVFHGQCAELCGLNHALMRFTVRVVTREEFEQWINSQEVKPPAEAAASNPK